MVVLLEAAGVNPVIAQSNFIDLGSRKHMRFAHCCAVAAYLLDTIEKSATIGHARKGGGNDRWAAAGAEAIECGVFGGENLVHTCVPLIHRLREHGVGEVVIAEAVCIRGRE